MKAKTYFYQITFKSIAIPLGLAMLFSCQPDLERIETITAADEEPIEILYNVKIIQSSSANTQVIMESPRMERYMNEEPYLELPEGLEVVFYDEFMNPTTKLSAKYAISYEEKNIIEARNDVEVINELNEKLNTEQLTWDQNKEIIYSEKFVKITTATEILYGEGFESDERFEKWKILHPRGSFDIEEP